MRLKVKKRLGIEPPPKRLVEQYLIEIAKNYNIAYVPEPSVMSVSVGELYWKLDGYYAQHRYSDFKMSTEVNDLINLFGLNDNKGNGGSQAPQAGNYAINPNDVLQQPGSYTVNPNAQIGFENVAQTPANQQVSNLSWTKLLLSKKWSNESIKIKRETPFYG